MAFGMRLTNHSGELWQHLQNLELLYGWESVAVQTAE